MICGKQMDENKMQRVFTGKARWICPECERIADREVGAVKHKIKERIERDVANGQLRNK